MPGLLISIRVHDGFYHGSGEWPPSPARLFQALVAGAARGENLSQHEAAAFKWLESLDAPLIVVPSALKGQLFRNFVPNNDLDAMGGDPKRIGEIRTAKPVRAYIFDAAQPLLYAWTFEPDADAERHARAISEIAANLYQFGRGVDMAWATGEVVNEVDTRLRTNGGVLWRPNKGGSGTELSCLRPGSLTSLTERFKAMRRRFKPIGVGKKATLLFTQAPKPYFRQVRYNSQSAFLFFEIRNDGGFVSQPLVCVGALTEKVRDLAVKRLKASVWRRDDPKREALADKIFVGRDSQEPDKARRIRIAPLPSIGHAQTERSIRRVLVAVPPDCSITTSDVAWAFSGLALDFDAETGEVSDDGAVLVSADDRKMLLHCGVEGAEPARLWRTVTPAALPERAARRRIDPRRIREEAKGGAERMREHEAADWAVRQALRHAGISVPVQAVRVQREPFEARGQRAEAFASGTRFAKERLWHVEIAFAQPVPGPLLIGDGRYLGLGLMAPVRHTDGVFAFAITHGLTDQAEPLNLARALRRAIMARVQEKLGNHDILPIFFTGHALDGAPAQSGRHEHLAFLFDAPRKRLLIVAPHILACHEAFSAESQHLRTLVGALEGFHELRAGRAGRVSLVSHSINIEDDPLFARSKTWESLTPYRVTRHAKLKDAAAALEADLLAECRRAGLPQPRVEVAKTFAKPGVGLFGLAKLRFHGATPGPVLLGRDRHFGGGLFVGTR